MTEVQKSVFIAAPIEKVWAALTDPGDIRGWMATSGSKVEVDLKLGGHYRLLGGDTTGKFTRIRAPNVLEYTWRQDEWKRNWPDSIVRWKLTSSGKGTQVDLSHDQFPNEDERKGHDEGWDIYWLEPMKAWLESGK